MAVTAQVNVAAGQDLANRAAVLHGARDLRIEEWPIPERPDGYITVDVEAVGVCGSDVHYYKRGEMMGLRVASPMVLGHEPSGRVVDPGSSSLAPDTLVAIEPQTTCGHCECCWNGSYNLCPSVQFMATPPVHGAMTNRIVVPAEFCFPVPAHVTPEEAALVEPLAVALWAGVKARIGGGDRVLVVGAGPVGMLTAQVAVALGSTEVVVVDPNETRAGFVNRFDRVSGIRVGPDDDMSHLRSFDVLVECSGAPGALDKGLSALGSRGRAALVGIGNSRRADLDVVRVQERELELVGVFRYAGMYRRAVSLLASQAVDVASLITHRYGLEQAADALSIGERDPSSIKAVVFPQIARL